MPNGKIAKTHPDAALAADRDYTPEIVKSMRETRATLTRTIWIVVVYIILTFMLLGYVLYHYIT